MHEPQHMFKKIWINGWKETQSASVQLINGTSNFFMHSASYWWQSLTQISTEPPSLAEDIVEESYLQ